MNFASCLESFCAFVEAVAPHLAWFYFMGVWLEGSERYKEPHFVCAGNNLHCSQISYPVEEGMFSVIEGDMYKLNPWSRPKRLFVMPTAELVKLDHNFFTLCRLKQTPLASLPTEIRELITRNPRYFGATVYFGVYRADVETSDPSKAVNLLERRARFNVENTYKDLVEDRNTVMENEASSIRRIVAAFKDQGVVATFKRWLGFGEKKQDDEQL